MKVFNRKSPFQRVLGTVTGALDIMDASARSLSGRPKPRSQRFKVPMPSAGSGHTRRLTLPKEQAMRAGVVAGGLAGLTAGSAGISSLRRRQGEARSDS